MSQDTKDYKQISAAVATFSGDLAQVLDRDRTKPGKPIKAVAGRSLFGLEIVLAVNQVLPAGSLFAPHSHPDAAEWVYCKKGTLSGRILWHPTPPPGVPSQTVVAEWRLSKGEAVFFPRGYVHYVLNTASRDTEFTLLFDAAPTTISVTEALAAIAELEPAIWKQSFEGQISQDTIDTFKLFPPVIVPALGRSS